MLVLEAEFSPGMRIDQCQAVAQAVERAGFDRLGVSDVVLWQDTYVVQALCARVTQHIELGAMVTNGYLRHPVVTAAAVAGLQELSNGRAFVGLGVGAGLEAAGVEYPRPIETLRESVTVLRSLFAGETVSFRGSVFRTDEAKLRVLPERAVPIAIGTRSPRVARLAGELADRALVGARYLSPAFADRYRAWVRSGEERAGRPNGSVEIAPRLTLCCSNDRAVAYETMRRDTAEFLVTLNPDDLQIEPQRFAAITEALSRAKGWYFDPDAYHPPELSSLVDDSLVERFSICGDAEDIIQQVRRIADYGFGSISFKLAPVRRQGTSMFEGLLETITSVASAVAEMKRLA
jgi:5,10-methylenetetrahydromethanopterin reductase